MAALHRAGFQSVLKFYCVRSTPFMHLLSRQYHMICIVFGPLLVCDGASNTIQIFYCLDLMTTRHHKIKLIVTVEL